MPVRIYAGCEEHFARCARFAKLRGPEYVRSFWETLWYLNGYGCVQINPDQEVFDTAVMNKSVLSTEYHAEQTKIPDAWYKVFDDRMTVCLSRDLSVASFGIMWFRKGQERAFMHGGMIYHGTPEGWDPSGGSNSPPFAVRLIADKHEYWSIHT